MSLPRRIAHLDMDAFYASVELLRYPQLKGLPVVIGGRRRREDDVLSQAPLDQIPVQSFPLLSGYVGRGVITTATYAARQFGVVRRISRIFKRTITGIAPVMEDRGIDEVYVDLTDVPGSDAEGGRALARHIQQRIFEETRLTCSIGVAPNKLLAKLASEFEKPNGISIVTLGDLERRIWPLPCRKVNGIGPRTDEKLASHNIRTVGDLAARDRDWLIEHYGKSYGAWLHEASWGRDERPVVTDSEPVSFSRETTFERDLHAVRDRAELGAVFTQLCEQLAGDLTRKGYAGRTIGIKLRFDNFKSVTRDTTIEDYTADAKVIRRQAGLNLKRVDLSRRIRLLGVRVGKLAKKTEEVPPKAS